MSVLVDVPDELEVLAGIAAWSLPFLRGDAPPFGSPEWLALDPRDHRRAAAVVRAALAWWRAGEPAEDVEDRVDRALARLASAGIAASLRRDTSGVYRPSYAEVAARRPSPAPRPHDYPGGPLPPWGPTAEET